MSRIGDRVGAILTGDDKVVQLIGFGVYEGDFVPLEAVGMFAEAGRELGHLNPRIKLDDGEVVYGCECWWGSEAEVRKQLEGREVLVVPPSVFREKYRFDESLDKATKGRDGVHAVLNRVFKGSATHE
jgi:hypothetical protein